MSFLTSIACLSGRHEPVRRKVVWNGRQFIGQCRHCDRPIERLAHRSWRERETELS